MDFACLTHASITRLRFWGCWFVFFFFPFLVRTYKGTFEYLLKSKAELFLCKRGKQNNSLILTRQAVINVTVTVSSSEAWTTFTQVTALNIMTQSVIFAGLWETFINIHGTSLPWKTESAEVRSFLMSMVQRLDANTAERWKYCTFPGTLPSQPGAHWQV